MHSYVSKVIESPIGSLQLIASGDGLVAVLWNDGRPGKSNLGEVVEEQHNPVLLETERQLHEYFSGQRQSFSLKLHFTGTPFQRRVWAALLTIPYGETRSYAQIARQIGSPQAVRAVGAANGRNPIPIIAPCHRVIGSDGTLTGFGGGLDRKARLLALEQETCAAKAPDIAQTPATAQIALPLAHSCQMTRAGTRRAAS